jgi:hypothetical protein
VEFLEYERENEVVCARNFVERMLGRRSRPRTTKEPGPMLVRALLRNERSAVTARP